MTVYDRHLTCKHFFQSFEKQKCNLENVRILMWEYWTDLEQSVAGHTFLFFFSNCNKKSFNVILTALHSQMCQG